MQRKDDIWLQSGMGSPVSSSVRRTLCFAVRDFQVAGLGMIVREGGGNQSFARRWARGSRAESSSIARQARHRTLRVGHWGFAKVCTHEAAEQFDECRAEPLEVVRLIGSCWVFVALWVQEWLPDHWMPE